MHGSVVCVQILTELLPQGNRKTCKICALQRYFLLSVYHVIKWSLMSFAKHQKNK